MISHSFLNGADVSIKEQVEFAKEELTQDEKLLAGLIRIERFYRRNKTLILGFAAILIIGGIGYGVMEYVKEQKLLKANEALLILQHNPDDRKALKILKSENPALAALYEVNRAIAAKDLKRLKELAGSKDPVVADLATYHAAGLERSMAGLDAYALKEKALVKDYALFDEAYLAMKKGAMAKAREKLARIPENSPLAPAAKMLAHYRGRTTQDGQ